METVHASSIDLSQIGVGRNFGNVENLKIASIIRNFRTDALRIEKELVWFPNSIKVLWEIKMTRPFFFLDIHKLFYCYVIVTGSILLTSCDRDERNGIGLPRQSLLATKSKIVDKNKFYGNGTSSSVPQQEPNTVEIGSASVGKEELEFKQLRQLRKIPYLSFLSDKQLPDFLQQLKRKSPAQRVSFLNGFPFLAGLPMQQQQILAEQLASIVPVTIQAKLLICNCGDDRPKQVCLPEDCSEVAAIRSTCEHLCGASTTVSTACKPAQECSRR